MIESLTRRKGWFLWHTSVILVLSRRQEDVYEFQVHLVYIAIPDQPELHNKNLSPKQKGVQLRT